MDVPRSSGGPAPAGDRRPLRRHRAVVLHVTAASDEHSMRTHESVAVRIADLLGLPFDGRFDPARHATGCYVVPDETLCPPEAAAVLGIRDTFDFFGGIVPFPFVATKCVAHGLVDPGSQRPPGWVEELAPALEGLVLPGYAAFAIDDAIDAVRRLLGDHGPVRLKLPGAKGGGGQSVHADALGAVARLRDLAPDAIASDGVVVETDLDEAVTWSVGTVQIGGLEAAYYGTQRTTTNNHGNTVYGGSTLHLVRGGWQQLLALRLPDGPREAVTLARRFDDLMHQAYPSLVASRTNYDVIHGRDARGRSRTAVLEQSWRVGGASGAEVAALAAFRDEPALHQVDFSTREHYGPQARPPAGAQVLFDGDDPDAGPVLKYVCVAGDDDR
jgi:hypothetical protein